MGGVPREVVSTITPGIDITQFLLLNREVVADTSSFTGVGGVTVLQVPNGELWYVHAANIVTAVLAVGQTCKVSIGVEQGGARIATGDPDNAIAAARAESFFRDLWLPPGSAVVGRCAELTAGPLTFTAAALITRLRI